MNKAQEYDVIIVGAGAAGMSAAVMLGRAKWRVVVLSLKQRRNSSAQSVHNVPYAHGVTPKELYVKMESDASSYGVEFVWDEALAAHASDGSVAVESKTRGVFIGKRLLLATGTINDLPKWIPEGAWGRRVFDCPFCHTAEHDGSAFVSVGAGSEALKHALLCRQYASTLTALVTEPEAEQSELANRLRKFGANVFVDRIESAASTPDGGLRLQTEQEREILAGAVVLDYVLKPNQRLPKSLGLELNDHGHPRATMLGQTSDPHVYTTGNTPGSPYFMWTGAASSGLNAARMICEDLSLGE